MMNMPQNQQQLLEAMNNCYQTKSQTIFQHGESVHSYYVDLLNILKNTSTKYEWRKPLWFETHSDILLKSQLPIDIVKKYHIYHDCGKPYCIMIDEVGRQHFPDHANISSNVYKNIFGDDMISTLIKHDMDIHILKSENDFIEFNNNEHKYTLLLTGLAEVHSNANMFGGISSDSFKIKFKKIDKIGKRLLK